MDAGVWRAGRVGGLEPVGSREEGREEKEDVGDVARVAENVDGEAVRCLLENERE